MKEQFVTYEIALKLKELGFDNNDFGHYDKNGELCIYSEYITSDTIISERDTDAPLWQQVIDWFREEKDIDIVITPDARSRHRKIERIYFVTLWRHLINLNSQPFIIKATEEPDRILYFLDIHSAREKAILKTIELCQIKK